MMAMIRAVVAILRIFLLVSLAGERIEPQALHVRQLFNALIRSHFRPFQTTKGRCFLDILFDVFFGGPVFGRNKKCWLRGGCQLGLKLLHFDPPPIQDLFFLQKMFFSFKKWMKCFDGKMRLGKRLSNLSKLSKRNKMAGLIEHCIELWKSLFVGKCT